MPDEEWAFHERFILAVRAPNGRKPLNHRPGLDGIFWIARTGSPWRDLPEVRQVVQRLPPVSALDPRGAPEADHGRIERKRAGSRRPSDDRQHRSPRPSSGSGRKRGGSEARFRPVESVRWEDDPPDRFLDHLPLHDQDPPPGQRCRPHLRSDISPGETSDHLGFDLAMDDNLPEPRVLLEPGVLLADRGHASDKVRKTMEARNVVPVIPMRKSRKLRVAVDRKPYRLRNLAERCFNKLKNARRVACPLRQDRSGCLTQSRADPQKETCKSSSRSGLRSGRHAISGSHDAHRSCTTR